VVEIGKLVTVDFPGGDYKQRAELNKEYAHAINRKVKAKHLTPGLRCLLRLRGGSVSVTWEESSYRNPSPYFSVHLFSCFGFSAAHVDRKDFKDAITALHSKISKIAIAFLSYEYTFDD